MRGGFTVQCTFFKKYFGGTGYKQEGKEGGGGSAERKADSFLASRMLMSMMHPETGRKRNVDRLPSCRRIHNVLTCGMYEYEIYFDVVLKVEVWHTIRAGIEGRACVGLRTAFRRALFFNNRITNCHKTARIISCDYSQIRAHDNDASTEGAGAVAAAYLVPGTYDAAAAAAACTSNAGNAYS